ncbi:MAG: hypothetical protein LBJ71_00010 [Holosporaceae bacterium]|jgi:hypothetical protein|nr:hypothetical protein [Holosporaceae bacterium]
MEIDTATLSRQALLLFNFWANKKQNNRRIGDLTIGDFFELCEILEETKNAAN